VGLGIGLRGGNGEGKYILIYGMECARAVAGVDWARAWVQCLKKSGRWKRGRTCVCVEVGRCG
jgi:hypothetical protein